MQSYSTLASIICIGTLSVIVSGSPFSFLPRYTVEKAIEQRSVDKPPISHVSNFLTPLADYETRSNEISKPVQDWTKITQNPVNGIEATVGSRVELECKASGSPPPEILWFTASGTNEQLIDYVKASTQHMYEPEEEWKGIARINSKLVIECVTPDDAGLIYCASVSAKKVKISSPTVLMVNGDHTNNNCSSDSDLTITLYSPTRVAYMGSTVELPCSAMGKPTPQISWTDNYNMPLSLSTNPRQRVLDNGNLLIENLIWEDMGGYTCKARSGHREQVVSTFLYPLRADTDVDRSIN